ncbi:MAG: hypothetical protein V2I27_10280 [Erythrobacter sp.]|jgi:hypothetical protein|nr:hypothetical protein [Erythrobacter sp.]
MTRTANTALSALLALVLTIGSIGAIVIVPPAQAHTASALDLAPLA